MVRPPFQRGLVETKNKIFCGRWKAVGVDFVDGVVFLAGTDDGFVSCLENDVGRNAECAMVFGEFLVKVDDPQQQQLHQDTKVFTPDQEETRKNFVRLYFSLRQLSALILTSQSRKHGDCLAVHGQLIGTALTASTAPTFVLTPSSSTSSKKSTSEKFSLIDFGAFPDRELETPTNYDQTVKKFLNFFEKNPQVVQSVADATCLSLSSQVLPVSASPSSSPVVRRGSHICDKGNNLWEKVHFQYYVVDGEEENLEQQQQQDETGSTPNATSSIEGDDEEETS